jgi:hypothetical protein
MNIDFDMFLEHLTEQIDNNVTACRLRAAKEDGKIDGMLLLESQIVRYFRGLKEQEDSNE